MASRNGVACLSAHSPKMPGTILIRSPAVEGAVSKGSPVAGPSPSRRRSHLSQPWSSELSRTSRREQNISRKRALPSVDPALTADVRISGGVGPASFREGVQPAQKTSAKMAAKPRYQFVLKNAPAVNEAASFAAGPFSPQPPRSRARCRLPGGCHLPRTARDLPRELRGFHTRTNGRKLDRP